MVSPPLIFCEYCGQPLYEKTTNQKYCPDGCNEEVHRENVRLAVERYRKRWKHLWGRTEPEVTVGSGFILSGHRCEDFEREYEIISKEKKRLGLK